MLSAIVINFRSHDLVNACLRSLLAGTMPPDDIVVIDNEAADGGLAPELTADPRVRLHLNQDNRGYAASCNTGAALAKETFCSSSTPTSPWMATPSRVAPRRSWAMWASAW